MDIQYENRYVATDKMMFEYALKIANRRRIVVCLLLLPIWIYMLVRNLGSGNPSELLLPALGILYTAGCIILSPYLTLRRMKKAELTVHNGERPGEIVRFSDEIVLSKGTSSMTLAYSQISAFRRLQHLWVLRIGKTHSILLDPAGFTIGNADDFTQFIRMKCPNLK